MGVADSLGKKFATIWQCIEEGYISKACRQGLLKLLKKCLVLLTEGEKDRACRRPLLNMSVRKPLNLVPQEQWWARAMEKLHGSCKNFCYTTAWRGVDQDFRWVSGWVQHTHGAQKLILCVVGKLNRDHILCFPSARRRHKAKQIPWKTMMKRYQAGAQGVSTSMNGYGHLWLSPVVKSVHWK